MLLSQFARSLQYLVLVAWPIQNQNFLEIEFFILLENAIFLLSIDSLEFHKMKTFVGNTHFTEAVVCRCSSK